MSQGLGKKEKQDYDMIRNYGVNKIVWRENGEYKQLNVTHRNGKVPPDLAVLYDFGELPEELERIIEEVGCGETKVSTGKTRLRREGLMEDDELVDVPSAALEDIQHRYYIEDGDLVMDHDLEDSGDVEGISTGRTVEEVLDYLSADERTDFWDLTRKICNDIYSEDSATTSIAKAGNLLERLETDEYKNVEGDKNKGYKLLE